MTEFIIRPPLFVLDMNKHTYPKVIHKGNNMTLFLDTELSATPMLCRYHQFILEKLEMLDDEYSTRTDEFLTEINAEFKQQNKEFTEKHMEDYGQALVALFKQEQVSTLIAPWANRIMEEYKKSGALLDYVSLDAELDHWPDYTRLMDSFEKIKTILALFYELEMNTGDHLFWSVIKGDEASCLKFLKQGGGLSYFDLFFSWYLCVDTCDPDTIEGFNKSLRVMMLFLYRPGRRQKSVFEVFSEVENRDRQLCDSILYDFENTSSDDSSEDDFTVDEYFKKHFGMAFESQGSSNQNDLDSQHNGQMVQWMSSYDTDSLGIIRKYNAYREKAYGKSEESEEPTTRIKAERMADLLEFDMQCLLYRGLHRGRRIRCDFLENFSRPCEEEVKQLQTRFPMNHLVILFYQNATPNWNVALKPTSGVLGSEIPLDVMFDKQAALGHLELSAEMISSIERIRHYLKKSPNDLEPSHKIDFRRLLQKWLNERFKYAYLQDATKKVSLSPMLAKDVEKYKSYQFKSSNLLNSYSVGWLANPEACFRTLDYSQRIKLQSKVEKILSELSLSSPKLKQKNNKLLMNREWEFINLYVNAYAKLFGDDNSRKEHCSHFGLNENPFVSTSFKLEKSMNYASGVRSPTNLQHTSHYRRSTGKAKHASQGYLRLYLVDKPYMDKLTRSVNEAEALNRLNIIRNYKHDGEIIFRGYIPARFFYQDIIYYAPPVALFAPKSKYELKQSLLNEIFPKSKNEEKQRFMGEGTKESSWYYGRLQEYLFSNEQEKQIVAKYIMYNVFNKKCAEALDQKVRKSIIQTHQTGCLYYPFSHGYANTMPLNLVPNNDSYEAYQKPEEIKNRQDMFSELSTHESNELMSNGGDGSELSFEKLSETVYQVYFRSHLVASKPKSVHDFLHACRVATWIREIYFIIEKHRDVIIESETKLGKVLKRTDMSQSKSKLWIAQLAGLFHDLGRKGEGRDKPEWEDKSAELFEDFMRSSHVTDSSKDKDIIDSLAQTIRNKSDKNFQANSLFSMLLYDADLFDIIRVVGCRGKHFDISRSYLGELLELENADLRASITSFVEMVIKTIQRNNDLKYDFKYSINHQIFSVEKEANATDRLRYRVRNGYALLKKDIHSIKSENHDVNASVTEEDNAMSSTDVVEVSLTSFNDSLFSRKRVHIDDNCSSVDNSRRVKPRVESIQDSQYYLPTSPN